VFVFVLVLGKLACVMKVYGASHSYKSVKQLTDGITSASASYFYNIEILSVHQNPILQEVMPVTTDGRHLDAPTNKGCW
jgi:hypothetical protein